MQAVAALSQPVTRVNELLHTRKGRKQADRLQVLAALGHAITATFQLLGMPINDPATLLQVRYARLFDVCVHRQRDKTADWSTSEVGSRTGVHQWCRVASAALHAGVKCVLV